MIQKIIFEEKNISLKDIQITLHVCAVYKGDKVNKSLDSLFDNRVSAAIKVDSFNGDFGKQLELYGNSKIGKLSLIGLGNKKNFNSDKLRAISANIIRSAESKKITSISIDSKSFKLNL